MKKEIIFFILFLITFNAFADIIRVDTNGTQDHETIMEAVAVAGEGDTILIYPDTYNENVISEKPITFASLYLTSGNEEYIDQTIIDGGQVSSVFTLTGYGYGFHGLIGLTITNGIGTPNNVDPALYGGGVYIYECDNCIIRKCHITENINGGGILSNYVAFIKIQECVVEKNENSLGTGGITIGYETTAELENNSINNNYGYSIGGIYATSTSYLYLSGNSIRYNKSCHTGGLNHCGSDRVFYSSDNLNSIYGNYGSSCCDFGVNDGYPVSMDTITCSNNSTYYIYYPVERKRLRR